MRRLKFTLCLLLGTLRLAAAERLLILAPHPDDETLSCGGVIQQAVADHVPIKIVFLTYGDFDKWAFSLYRRSPVFRPKTMRAMGEVRRQEALAAARVLGVPDDALIFLGYPDYETLTIWNSCWAASPPYESRNTRVSAVPYTSAYRPQAPYKGEDILQDLETILKDFQPTKVIVSDPADRNVDHRALALFLRVALWDAAPARMPDVYSYLIHFPHWPAARGLHAEQALDPPPSLADAATWVRFPLTAPQTQTNYEALEKHRTQCAYSNRFLTSFVRRNELFNAQAFGKRASADFETWEVAVDSGDLVVTGRLAPGRRAASNYKIAAFGYRRDTPFAKMPKLYATFKILRGRRDFTARIALSALNQPEKIIVGCEASPPHAPFRWSSWRVVE